MKVRLGGEWRDIIGAKIRQANKWRTIAAVKIYSGGAWRDAGTFSVASTPEPGGVTLELDLEEGSTSGTGSVIQSETQVNAIPRNGRRPFTYLWEVVSQSGPGTVSIDTPTVASTSLTCTFSSTGTVTATIRCTATDSVGSEASDEGEYSFIRTA